MIDEIQVKDLALIARASLEPCAGLTVLTGETGAGKTALLSALKLLMGERADKTLVRDGRPELYVAGRFFAGGEECVAVRRVTADGRSRVTLDGEMAGVTELAARVAPGIDLCSQNEHQQLIRPATHVGLLDAWIGEEAASAAATYRAAFDEAAAARAALDTLLQAAGAGAARLDEARFILRRIEAVNPKEGEYEELLADLHRAENAEALFAAADGIYTALVGDESGANPRPGAADLVQDALRISVQARQQDPTLGEISETLRGVLEVLMDEADTARNYRDDLEFDEETLAAKQERAAALQGLIRAYGPRMEDVFAAWAKAKDLVSAVDDADLRQEEARRALAKAEERLAAAEAALHKVRAGAAPAFAAQVTAQMQRLEMGSARLEVRTEALPREKWTRVGGDAVEFLFASGAGLTTRPLAKIASGGEISRVMLALKVVLGESDAVDTLVFDEIDAGVGGATALALGEVIADLARTHQVIVVTHLAQVAARAERHYLVAKSADAVPETTLTLLEDDARTREIARMLGGTVSAASLAHAAELLAAGRAGAAGTAGTTAPAKAPEA